MLFCSYQVMVLEVGMASVVLQSEAPRTEWVQVGLSTIKVGICGLSTPKVISFRKPPAPTVATTTRGNLVVCRARSRSGSSMGLATTGDHDKAAKMTRQKILWKGVGDDILTLGSWGENRLRRSLRSSWKGPEQPARL